MIELLVVVSVIALLIGILLPALSGAKRSAKRAACAAHLRQIGVGMQAYLEESNHRLPFASYVPSISAAPLDLDDEEAIYIADVLRPHVGHAGEVFRCPGDQASAVTRESPNEDKTYFATEKSSYEYRVRRSVMGKTILEAVQFYEELADQPVSENTIWLLRDYDNFHGEAGTPGSRRYLYIDGHVGDYEQF